MPVINIEIKNKIALNPANAEYICGNADFLIDFAFDAEWDAYVTKTARFVWNSGYQDIVFQGNQCEVPVISNTATILCGVFAGDLHTTTPALIRAQKSILCGNSPPAAPAPDVYAQMVALFNAGLDESRVNANRAETAKTAAEDSAKNAAASQEKAAGYTSHPPIHGDNGNWLLWNGTEYEDSGKPYTFTEKDKQDVMDEVISHFINVSEVGL